MMRLLTRTGTVDAKYCTRGDDITLLVLEKSSACHLELEIDSYDVADRHTSINPAEATNAILPVVSWGKLAAKDVATPPP